MSDSGRRSAGGFTGHPAIIFWLMTDYGRADQSICSRITSLDKWADHLEACVSSKENFETDFKPVLDSTRTSLLECWEAYDPVMESAGYSLNEKWLLLYMRNIYSSLTLLTAKGHVCDAIGMRDMGDDVE